MASAEGPSTEIEIRADGGGTAIGRVHNLNTTDASGTAIGQVQNFKLFLQAAAAAKGTTTVLDVSSMQTYGSPFVGRQEHLTDLHHFLGKRTDRTSLAVVTGPAGVGKTALVREAMMSEIAETRFAHALFADMRGYEQQMVEPVQAEDVYGSLLHGLGVPAEVIPESSG